MASVPLSMGLTQLLVRLHLPFYVSGRGLDLSPDWRVFVVMAALSVTCGLLLGLLPAWRAWTLDVRSGLTGVPGRAPTTRSAFGRWDLRHVLAALQIAVCLILTIGAALLGKSLAGLVGHDMGFHTDRVTLFGLETYWRNYTGEQNARLWDALNTRVRRLPGVESAAFAADVIPTRFKPMQQVFAPDALDQALRVGLAANVNAVTSDYFETLRLPLTAGRAFRSGDTASGAAAAAIVDERTALRTWGSPTRAIGRRIRIGNGGAEHEVVGVARDATYRDDESTLPYIFVPLDDSWTGAMTLHVRGPRQPDLLVEHVRRELRALDRSLAFSEILTFDEFVRARLAAPNVAAQLAVAASVTGFVLAMIGLYAVLTNLVSQRRAELAIRMAVGAAPHEIVWLVAWAGMKVACVGATLGVLGSLLTMRAITTQLRGVDVHDPLIYIGVCTLVLAAALIAALVPAHRAGQLEPWVILRR
jgi:predicted permease